MELVELWMMIQIRHKVKYYYRWKLTQLLIKFPQALETIDSETIKSGVQIEYQGSKATKLQPTYLSIEHRTNLAAALEDAGKVPTANQVRNMKGREDVRYLSRRIKYIEGKIRKSVTSFVTHTLNDGTV